MIGFRLQISIYLGYGRYTHFVSLSGFSAESVQVPGSAQPSWV